MYVDGNSLGRLPKATEARLARVIHDEWGRDLIRSWDHWLDLPGIVGDELAASLLGAEPGEVVVNDSTTVNLYKLAVAALDARPGRTVIVTDAENFPTDRYVFEGLAAQRGLELRMLASDPVEGLTLEAVREALDESVALVSFSHVAYVSGALADMAAITAAVHDAGALVLWDLCHSVGAVPVELGACGVDLAVGCTYKYLNAGPGAPAFAYVRRSRQAALRQPIWGWFGQHDQFAMGPRYDPEAGIRQFVVGTPPVLGLVGVQEGARLLAAAGIDRLRAKGSALTEFAIACHDEWLAPLGFSVGSPRDASRRGSHVSLRHPEAERLCVELRAAGVIPDFRRPDRVRIGPAPITARFTDVWDALDRLRQLAG